MNRNEYSAVVICLKSIPPHGQRTAVRIRSRPLPAPQKHAPSSEICCSIDHLRPEGRIKKDSGDWSSACQLEPDKTAFWLKLPSASASAAMDSKGKGVVIAVEIKPKDAVMLVGTLVPPGNNRLKYRVARFAAQQRFKAQVIMP